MTHMIKTYKCGKCGFIYQPQVVGLYLEDRPDNDACPACHASKSAFSEFNNDDARVRVGQFDPEVFDLDSKVSTAFI